jgi:hypothetical protein
MTTGREDAGPGPAGGALLAHPVMRRRMILALGALLLALLAPLPYLGDLREQHRPYLLLMTAATLALYGGSWLLGRIGAVPSGRAILGVALVLRLAMLPMAPSLSDDAYRYLWDGRLLLHGVNPYHQPPSAPELAAFHDDLYRLQGYPTTNTIYPPGAQIVFASAMAFAEVAGGGHAAGYIAYKLFLIAIETAAIALLLRLLARLGLPMRGALLYAWHPLAIVELAGQGHTDAFWTLSLGLGLVGYAAAKSDGGMAGLALGSVLRLYPLPLLPLWARFLGAREALRGLLVSLPLMLLFIVFLDPVALGNYTTVLLRFTNFYEFNGGFYYAVKGALDAWHVKPSNAIAGAAGGALQLLVLLAAVLWPVRDRSPRALAWRALLVVTAMIVLGAKVHVWYFVAPLYMLPVVGARALNRAWLWAALAAPFTYLMYASGAYHERYDVVAIEWGGFALLAVYDSLRERYRAARAS